MLVRFIGDVHGKYRQYKNLIKNIPSIQVGDMGVGFIRKQGPNVGETYSNPPYYKMIKGNHRFIRGNHDNLTICKKHSQWIPDGTVENKMMFIGGANSIDREYRTEGYDWWEDEQLSTIELNNIHNIYFDNKPEIMVTHDCPEEVCYLLNKTYLESAPRTRQALQQMFETHKPKLWIFGHWHMSFEYNLFGTKFICLNELEFKDIEIA
ncbi:MAG TPA: metallophosphoesterase family protein [Methylomirabilota bacterium]|nr:metallophosphoesterase family protein [Methylomirabilota bacterium]